MIDAGHYRLEPSLIAQAMLRRRCVREPAGRAAGRHSTQLIEPDRLQTPAVRQPDLHPASRRPPRRSGVRATPAASRSRGAASSQPLGGPGRQQLVVLAARDGELQRRPVPPPPATSATPAAIGRAPASICIAAPLASARRVASPPSPSLRSIIAVAPAAGQGASRGEPWQRLELPRHKGGASLVRRPAAAPPSSSSRPAAAPPSSPVSARASPGRAPGLVTSSSGDGGVADDGHRQHQRGGARVRSPPAMLVPVRGGQLGEPVEELDAAVLVQVVGDAEDRVGLARARRPSPPGRTARPQGPCWPIWARLACWRRK